MQWGAGWTDLFQQSGLEKVENRKLDWDPVHKRYGPGPEISEQQEKLKEAYTLMNDILPQRKALIGSKVEEWHNLQDSNKRNRDIINSTSLDEALEFLDVETLNETLNILDVESLNSLLREDTTVDFATQGD